MNVENKNHTSIVKNYHKNNNKNVNIKRFSCLLTNIKIFLTNTF